MPINYFKREVTNIEKWKQLPYHEGQFFVSTEGRFYNETTERYLIGDTNNFGYHRVSFWHNGKVVRRFKHRLVAKAFIPNPLKKNFVNHIDGDKDNNSAENLEWVTQSDNELHAYSTGLKVNPHRKNIKILFMNGNTKTFSKLKEAGDYIGVSASLVGEWARQESSTYSNYGIKKVEYIK